MTIASGEAAEQNTLPADRWMNSYRQADGADQAV